MAKRPPPKTDAPPNRNGHGTGRDQTIAAASRAAASLDQKNDGQSLTLSTGVVLAIKQAPPYAIQSASTEAGDPPTPPTVWIEDNGREEENPNDPEYLRELQRYRVKQTELLSNVLFLFGTEPITIPDGVPHPEEDAWISKLAAAGIRIDPSDDYERYLGWMRYVALGTTSDIQNLTQAVIRGVGATEEDVQQALDTFRSDEEGGTDQ